MIGRLYTVSFTAVAISAIQDLFEITPADDKPCALAGITLDNVGGTADFGDSQAEGASLIVRRGYTTSGSGGSAPTPAPVHSTDPAAGFAAEVNNTTVATTGTAVDIWPLGWNVQIPLREFLPEEFMPMFSQADTRLVVRLLTAPNDAITVSGAAWVVEMG